MKTGDARGSTVVPRDSAGDPRESAGGPAVVLDGLGRRFGGERAVDALSFEVARGELFGVVGPDGAGKTTLLRMLAGVLPPGGGDATVLGTSVAREPESVKPRIAYMAQRFGLYEDLTVRENIEFYADLYRVPRGSRPERIERLHAFSGLGPFEDRLAGDLSGGMKQKLALSCALVHEPEVMLLDEPTFGVDPISRRELWRILHEMVERGVTVLVSTSYLDEAERCDRVALLHEGRLLSLDSPERLRRSTPGALFILETDRPRLARDTLRELPGVRRAALFGDSLHVLLDDAAAGPARLRSALRARGIGPIGLEEAEPSLEDVFIDRVASDG